MYMCDHLLYKREPTVNPCQTCGSNNAMKRCARCARVRYCDIQCAQEDYGNHKIECRLWRLSSINAEIIDANHGIKALVDHTKDWECLLLFGSTCKSWRSYIKSMYILDDTHKLYYTDDNLVGVSYSLRRRNPAYKGDYYSDPIYESMAKSRKAPYSVLKYINYVNKSNMELNFLAYRLCKYGSDELYKCLYMALNDDLPIKSDYDVLHTLIPIEILIENYLLRCENKYITKNVIAIGRIIHKIVTDFDQHIDTHNRSTIDGFEKKIRERFGDDIAELWHDIVYTKNNT